MNWHDSICPESHVPFDENQRAILGYWLTTVGVDLENIPDIFSERYELFPKTNIHGFDQSYYTERKVMIKNIIGTSHEHYGDTSLIDAYMRLGRASDYIKSGCVTLKAYNLKFHKKASLQTCSQVILTKLPNGKFYVDGNGNHRVIFYKLMMLSEISKHQNSEAIHDIYKSYWINAFINPSVN